MISFYAKQIENPLTLGERLCQARQGQALRLKDIAAKISVSEKYLQAIEKSRYALLPGDVYARNFIKVYAAFVGINPTEAVARYESERSIYKKTKEQSAQDFSKPVRKVSARNLIVGPRLLRNSMVLILVFGVLGYLGTKVNAIVTPPELVIDSPVNNLVISQNLIEVSGRVEAEAVLEINGQQALADESGFFSELIDLQHGTNIIEIRAEKRHGTETKIYRQVVVVDGDEITGSIN